MNVIQETNVRLWFHASMFSQFVAVSGPKNLFSKTASISSSRSVNCSAVADSIPSESISRFMTEFRVMEMSSRRQHHLTASFAGEGNVSWEVTFSHYFIPCLRRLCPTPFSSQYFAAAMQDSLVMGFTGNQWGKALAVHKMLSFTSSKIELSKETDLSALRFRPARR